MAKNKKNKNQRLSVANDQLGENKSEFAEELEANKNNKKKKNR